MDDGITPREFHEAEGTGEWRLVGDGATTFYATDSLADAGRLVAAIADVPGVDDHDVSVDVRGDGVTVRLITVADDWYGPSRRDVELARAISAAAQQLGFRGDPRRAQSVLVIPGAPDVAAVMPFWRAILGYEPRRDSPEEDLVDPANRGPAFWFEEMHDPRPDGGGAIHISVWVPPESAEARVAAALAAGGRMVRDDFAPMWWTLADAAGNEADVSTVLNRE